MNYVTLSTTAAAPFCRVVTDVRQKRVAASAKLRHVKRAARWNTAGPAPRDGLRARVELHGLDAVDVEIAKERLLPAAERVERHRHRNRYVDAHHADLHVLLEEPRRRTRSREQGRSVSIRIAVDQCNGVLELAHANDDEHRSENFILINRHLGR